MRKINPAIRGVLSAALAMGMGTAVIAGADFMTHGLIPTADAAAHTDATITCQKVLGTSVGEEGHSAILLDSGDQFQTTGTITITTSETGHTGPFDVKFALPQNWADRQGTITQFSPSDSSSVDSSLVKHGMVGDKLGYIMVSGPGIENGKKVVFDFTVKTGKIAWTQPSAEPSNPSTDTPSTDTPSTDTPSTDTPSTDTPSTDTPSTDTPSQTDADAEKKQVRDELDSLEFVIDGPKYNTDWSQPSLNIAIAPTSETKIAPGQEYGDGQVTVNFNDNCAGVKLEKLAFGGNAASTSESGAMNATLDTQWQVYRHETEGDVSSPLKTVPDLVDTDSTINAYAGERAIIGYKVKANVNAAAIQAMREHQQATVEAAVQVTGSHGGITGGTLERKTGTASFSIAETALSIGSIETTNMTSPGHAITIGDKVALSVPVTSSGHTASGQIRVLIMNADLDQNVGIASVENVSGNNYAISSDKKYVDINLPAMQAGTTTTYKVVLDCGTLDSATVAALNNKTVKINAAAAMLGESLESVSSLATGTPKAEFEIAAPTAEIASVVTDPSVKVADAQAAYKEEIVTNLGDVARFKVTLTNKSKRIIKDVRLSDTLLTTSKDGSTPLDNTSTACVDILQDTILLTKGDATVATTNTLTPGVASEHPNKLEVVPTNSLSLLPDESITLQYDAKMGHTEIAASSQNMRGATVRNSPVLTATNTAANSVTKSTSAAVTIATAELSTDLSVTKDKISVGEKTTYVMTVQSVEQRSTTFSDEYAIGLHMTGVLDENARFRGYKHDLGSLKLYYVSGGSVKEVVPPSDYTLEWVEPEDGHTKETTFTLDINADKANAYKIKNVSPSQVSTTTDNSHVDEEEPAANGEAVLHSEATSGDTVLPTEATATKDRNDDVATIAEDIKEGFIITYDGITNDVTKGFVGEIKTKTDVLVRADNAGFALDREPVTIVGDDLIIPETANNQSTENGGGQSGNTNGNTSGQNGSTSRKGTNAPLISTDVGMPASLGVLVAGIAGWAYTRYRKVRRR